MPMTLSMISRPSQLIANWAGDISPFTLNPAQPPFAKICIMAGRKAMILPQGEGTGSKYVESAYMWSGSLEFCPMMKLTELHKVALRSGLSHQRVISLIVHSTVLQGSIHLELPSVWWQISKQNCAGNRFLKSFITLLVSIESPIFG